MRIVAKRKQGGGDRASTDALALRFRGGAPKGVFRCKTAVEANRDQDPWMIEGAQQRLKMSSGSQACSKRRGVEYARIGGYALALQGIVRTTDDVDILVEPTAENAASIDEVT